MSEKKFDPKKLKILNNPQRLFDIPPDTIWARLNMEQADTIVDIGAGTGFFSVPFLDYTADGTIFACDTSDIMLDWMKDNVCPTHPSVIPVKVDEIAVPLEDGLADLVFMINLHHELEFPDATLKESLRLLKNKGKFFIVDWKKEEMSEGPPLHLRCSVELIKEQMTDANFDNIRIYNDLPKHSLIIAEKR